MWRTDARSVVLTIVRVDNFLSPSEKLAVEVCLWWVSVPSGPERERDTERETRKERGRERWRKREREREKKRGGERDGE